MRDTTRRATLLRRGPKLARAEIETLQRRSVEHFRILSAITDLLPRGGDIDGRAAGTLNVAELAARAGVSNKAIDRSLWHWREWRVLWLFWKGAQVWDVRFERTVVEALLTAWTTSSRKVGQLLIEHRRQREAVAPRRNPKTSYQQTPQAAEESCAEAAKGAVPKISPTFAPSRSQQVVERRQGEKQAEAFDKHLFFEAVRAGQ